jgi:hypothetical protein
MKPHKAEAVVMVMPPLVDADMHLPVAVDARPSVEELEGLEVKVPVRHRCHRCPKALKLMTKRRKLSPNRSKAILSRSSRHRPTWWT